MEKEFHVIAEVRIALIANHRLVINSNYEELFGGKRGKRKKGNK